MNHTEYGSVVEYEDLRHISMMSHHWCAVPHVSPIMSHPVTTYLTEYYNRRTGTVSPSQRLEPDIVILLPFIGLRVCRCSAWRDILLQADERRWFIRRFYGLGIYSEK